MEIVAFILFLIGIFKRDNRFYKAAGAFILFDIVLYALAFGSIFLIEKMGV